MVKKVVLWLGFTTTNGTSDFIFTNQKQRQGNSYYQLQRHTGNRKTQHQTPQRQLYRSDFRPKITLKGDDVFTLKPWEYLVLEK